ncbi:MAG: hypothetical protein P8Y34_04240 [Anaerolineales bacterium]
MDKIRTFIESGRKRTFAAAIDWPGWCRRGRDENTALEALLESGPRYQEVLSRSTLPFQSPCDIEYFAVVERVPGSSTTDFGAPDGSLITDDEPVNDQDLDRWLKILRACWEAFDKALQSAEGKELKKACKTIYPQSWLLCGGRSKQLSKIPVLVPCPRADPGVVRSGLPGFLSEGLLGISWTTPGRSRTGYPENRPGWRRI